MMAGKAFRDRQQMPGLLQYISNLFVQYFSACANCSLSTAPPTIDTTFISQKIGAQDSFKAPMDQIMREAMDKGFNKPTPANKQKDKNKQRDKDGGSPNKPPNKKNKGGGGGGRRETADIAYKTDPNHPGFNQWYDGLLACNIEQFRKLLKHQSEAPKFNGTNQAACLNFHIHGGCKAGKECTRVKSHAKPSPDFKTKFKAWRSVTIA
jgi:hypothetical protein